MRGGALVGCKQTTSNAQALKLDNELIIPPPPSPLPSPPAQSLSTMDASHRRRGTDLAAVSLGRGSVPVCKCGMCVCLWHVCLSAACVSVVRVTDSSDGSDMMKYAQCRSRAKFRFPAHQHEYLFISSHLFCSFERRISVLLAAFVPLRLARRT